MRASLLPLAAVTAALVVAGCLGSPAPPEEPLEPSTEATVTQPVAQVEAPLPPEPRMQVFPFAGSITLGAGAAGVGYVSPTGMLDPHVFPFPVEAGVVAVVAELAWDDATHDLDLNLGPPGCDATGAGCIYADGGAWAAGDSPVRIVLTDPAALNQTGEWHLFVWAKNAVNVEFRTAATVFYGLPPSDTYTALDP